jgi:hypothetical protein
MGARSVILDADPWLRSCRLLYYVLVLEEAA